MSFLRACVQEKDRLLEAASGQTVEIQTLDSRQRQAGIMSCFWGAQSYGSLQGNWFQHPLLSWTRFPELDLLRPQKYTLVLFSLSSGNCPVLWGSYSQNQSLAFHPLWVEQYQKLVGCHCFPSTDMGEDTLMTMFITCLQWEGKSEDQSPWSSPLMS